MEIAEERIVNMLIKEEKIEMNPDPINT